MTRKDYFLQAARNQAASPVNVQKVLKDLHHFTGGVHKLFPSDAQRVMGIVVEDMEKVGTVPEDINAVRSIVLASYARALDVVVAEIKSR